MKIKSTSGRRDLKIEKENRTLAELKYKNWYASDAECKLINTHIEIKPRNVWGSKFDIYKNGRDKGDILFNWKGDIIVRLVVDDKIEKNWILRYKGLWKPTFQLFNEKEERIIVFKPIMSWTKIKYHYEVELVHDEVENNQALELILYSCYGKSLYDHDIMTDGYCHSGVQEC